MVEHQPSKLRVAGSSPVFRSVECRSLNSIYTQLYHLIHEPPANVAQSVEHIHGKDEVTSSILVIGSSEREQFRESGKVSFRSWSLARQRESNSAKAERSAFDPGHWLVRERAIPRKRKGQLSILVIGSSEREQFRESGKVSFRSWSLAGQRESNSAKAERSAFDPGHWLVRERAIPRKRKGQLSILVIGWSEREQFRESGKVSFRSWSLARQRESNSAKAERSAFDPGHWLVRERAIPRKRKGQLSILVIGWSEREQFRESGKVSFRSWSLARQRESNSAKAERSAFDPGHWLVRERAIPRKPKGQLSILVIGSSEREQFRESGKVSFRSWSLARQRESNSAKAERSAFDPGHWLVRERAIPRKRKGQLSILVIGSSEREQFRESGKVSFRSWSLAGQRESNSAKAERSAFDPGHWLVRERAIPRKRKGQLSIRIIGSSEREQFRESGKVSFRFGSLARQRESNSAKAERSAFDPGHWLVRERAIPRKRKGQLSIRIIGSSERAIPRKRKGQLSMLE